MPIHAIVTGASTAAVQKALSNPGSTPGPLDPTAAKAPDAGQPQNGPGPKSGGDGSQRMGTPGAPPPPGGGLTPGIGIDGAKGTDPNNNCGCLPPDTNAAVNGTYVVETVNEEFVVFDQATGTRLFSETLDSLFSGTGQSSLGDVYVVWDPLVNRWYVDSIDANNEANLLFAVSNDSNPLDGFSNQYVIPSAAPGDLADFPKFGYNAEYITFSANDFGDAHAQVTVINKADALAGALIYVQLTPSYQFRALVPAQDPTATPGEPIWFVGSPYLGLGSTNNVIRVTKLVDPFGAATFTDYYPTVDTYGGFTSGVDQPGGFGSVAANDNTTTQVFERNGELVTAFPASTAADGYYYPKVHYYTLNVSSGSPVLDTQGVVDPGYGVATFFPSAALDPSGDIGLTWMESSSSEYVSMYVGAVTPGGSLSTYDATRARATSTTRTATATTARSYLTQRRARSGRPTSTPVRTTSTQSGTPGSRRSLWARSSPRRVRRSTPL